MLTKEEETHNNQKTLQEKKVKLENLIKTLKSKIDSLSDAEIENQKLLSKIDGRTRTKTEMTEQDAKRNRSSISTNYSTFK